MIKDPLQGPGGMVAWPQSQACQYTSFGLLPNKANCLCLAVASYVHQASHIELVTLITEKPWSEAWCATVCRQGVRP